MDFKSADLNAQISYNPDVTKQRDALYANNNQATSIFMEANVQDAETLKEDLKEVEDKQGLMGKLWNGFKNLTGLGHSSNDVEEKIEKFENGEISYEEASASIDEFEQKQNSATDMAASVASGLVVAGVAAATGGVGLVGAAAIGGGAKAVIKTTDRATNEIAGDELDLKQIGKDALTGAVDGAVTMGTMGIGAKATAVAGQSVTKAIGKGAMYGAAQGAITGGAMGAANYTAEAIFEDGVDFSIDEMLKTAGQGALVGGVMGGVMGGVANGVKQGKLNTKVKVSHNKSLKEPINHEQQAKDYIDNYNANCEDKSKIIQGDAYEQKVKELTELSKKGQDLAKTYNSQINESSEQINQIFSNKDDIEVITTRPKGQKSSFSKLASKNLKGKTTDTMDDCLGIIGDSNGFRIQMKSLSTEESASVVEKVFKENNINATFDDYVKYLQGDKSISAKTSEAIAGVSDDIMGKLTSKQADSTVKQLAEAIKTGKIDIDEINVYGENSYFTKEHVAMLTDAKTQAVEKEFTTGKKLKIVSSLEDELKDSTAKSSKELPIHIEKTSKGAIKESGYLSAQMNTRQVLKDGSVVKGELQIRGTEVNGFADVEHIPYDIRTGKITAGEAKYQNVYSSIKGLSKESYKEYNNYLTDTYHHLRMEELGIPSPVPQIPSLKYADENTLQEIGQNDMINKADKKLTDEELYKLTPEGLSKYAHTKDKKQE